MKALAHAERFKQLLEDMGRDGITLRTRLEPDRVVFTLTDEDESQAVIVIGGEPSLPDGLATAVVAEGGEDD